MTELADLIATLRLAAELYGELGVVDSALPDAVDLGFAAATRLRLAADLENASGVQGAAVSPLAGVIGDWREGSSAMDLVTTIESGIGRLAAAAYLVDLGPGTKELLESVGEVVEDLLAQAGGSRAAGERGEDGFAATGDEVRKDVGRCPADDHRAGGEGIDLFPVWFGTNRAPVKLKDPSKGFSGKRSVDGVRYGQCFVHVPRSHRIGSLGSNLLRRVFTGDDRLTVHSRKPFGANEFWHRFNAAANDEERGRQAVVFIHGYRVGFDDAALRAAQLGFDLSVNGPMSFFSWPSKGRLLGYFADGSSIEASSAEITEFLVAMACLPRVEQVHVIAHSMGNRGALAAVCAIAADAQRLSGRRFGQFVLAAADVDSEVFRRGAAAYGEVGSGTTLYVSPHDQALRLSSRISSFARIGRVPPVSVLEGIDTVDVGGIDLEGLGHGYVGENRGVLADMHALLGTGSRAADRFGLTAEAAEGGGTYWRFKS